MPSKSTFALVALLAATSVSALPTRGSWVDLVERGPDTPVATPAGGPVAAAPAPVAANGAPAVVPPAAMLAQTPVSGASGTASHHNQHPHQHPHGHGHGHGHQTRRQSHDKVASTDGTTTPHKKHRRRHSTSGSAVTPPVNVAAVPLTPPAVGGTVPATPPTQGTTLTRREFYEELYTRDPTGHHHHHHHHHHHPHHPQPAAVDPQTQSDPNAAPPAPIQSREFIERRGLLETLGLKARVSNLTVKQTDQMTKAKTICGGLASRKDQHACHKNIDKVIQLSKERNYDVAQFIKLTNHHDVFTASDPSLTSSSTPSSSH